MRIFSLSNLALLLSGSMIVQSSARADDSIDVRDDEYKLVVTAELDETNVLDLPASVSVIDEETISQRNAQHFSDVLNLAPNVNFATGASRGRFVQIRGIGERSEFSEPVNYSVGVVVDGIDLTGIATAATLLDIQQVEILRGPQGTIYGANGLAGLINIVSNSPTASLYSKFSGSVEEFGGRSLSAIVSDSVSEKFGYRISAGKYQSDGFMDNIFLGRDDSNNIDEASIRGKFVYQADDGITITSNLFFVDIDNGYDAFSLESNRNTLSDEPGHDRQQTRATSFLFDWRFKNGMRLETLLGFANSDLEYGFDEDWSHPGICDNTACDSELWGFDWWFSSFDNYQRDNNNTSLDIRLHSGKNDEGNSWVIGFYARDQKIDLKRTYTFLENDFFSQFDTTNTALYAQYRSVFAKNLILTGGLRLENRDATYNDSESVRFNPNENLWGGKVSLEYHYAPGKIFYGLISRGFKAGGFNTDGSISAENREYDTEFMWNYEAGVKGNWFDDKLTMQASIFFQDREDIQTKQSIVRSLANQLPLQEGGICPCSFTDFIDNAAEGSSYGAELEMSWRATDDLQYYTTLGLLKTEFKNFQSFTHVNADLEAIPPIPFDLNGRDLAHAPDYQLTVGLNYFISDNWRFNPEIEAKDGFFFSDRHEEKSESYELLNLRLTYLQDNWQLHFYAHNLTDKDVQTRGFGSFGNDPRKFYEVEPYFQFAAPRVIGISASVEFE